MKEYKLTDWLPTTKKEVELRGWDELDVILFSGDAYVATWSAHTYGRKHPSKTYRALREFVQIRGFRHWVSKAS